MTFTPANDQPMSGPRHPCGIDMSVLELAAFMRAFRSGVPSSGPEIATTLGHWFQCNVDPRDLTGTLLAMVARGWLANHASGFRATRAGRRHARTHLRGIVMMLDQGTNYLEVHAMMSMLRIARNELDGEHDDENLDD